MFVLSCTAGSHDAAWNPYSIARSESLRFQTCCHHGKVFCCHCVYCEGIWWHGGTVPLIFNFATRENECSASLLIHFTPWGMNPRFPLNSMLSGFGSWFEFLEFEGAKNLFFPAGSWTTVSQSSSQKCSCYIRYAVLGVVFVIIGPNFVFCIVCAVGQMVLLILLLMWHLPRWYEHVEKLHEHVEDDKGKGLEHIEKCR